MKYNNSLTSMLMDVFGRLHPFEESHQQIATLAHSAGRKVYTCFFPLTGCKNSHNSPYFDYKVYFNNLL